MKGLIGKIVSVNMQKTAVVEVKKSRPHPLYKKIIRGKKKYKVHYEGLDLKVGDKVEIMPTRPISKEKHFRVVNKVNKAMLTSKKIKGLKVKK